MDDRIGHHHLGIEQRIAADLPVEISAMAIGPVDHRRYREDRPAGFQGLGIEVRSRHAALIAQTGEKRQFSPRRAAMPELLPTPNDTFPRLLRLRWRTQCKQQEHHVRNRHPPSQACPAARRRHCRALPVRRVYCVGRNYADHAIEMGHDPSREPPFFFQKNADNLLPTARIFPIRRSRTTCISRSNAFSR
jgi:hypothetical protein